MSAPAGNSASEVDRRFLGILLVLVSMFAFALMDGLAKIISQSIAIPQIMWIRNIVFAGLMIALLQWQKLPLRQIATSARPGLQLFRALLLLCESATFMLAFRMMPLADVHAIAAASPLIVIALSALVLGERVGPRRAAAVAIGFCGVLLIVRPGFATVDYPVLISLLAAVLWASYQIIVRLSARFDRSETTTLWTALVGLGVTTAIGPMVWLWPTPAEWAGLLAIAILGAIAHVTLIKALTLTEATLLQPYSYTLFVWAVVIGYVMFGHLPDVWTLVGALVIVASGVYVWYRERNLARQH